MTLSRGHGDAGRADVVDDGATDVLSDDEVVRVPAAVAELVEAVEHQGETFVAEVPDWDEPDERHADT